MEPRSLDGGGGGDIDDNDVVATSSVSISFGVSLGQREREKKNREMEREREVVYCRFRQPSRSTSIKVSYRVWRRRTRRRFVSFRSFVHSFIHSSQCRVDFGFYWLLAASWVLIVFWNRFFRRQSISTFARIAYVFRWISQIGIDFLWIEFRPRSLSCVPFSTL